MKASARVDLDRSHRVDSTLKNQESKVKNQGGPDVLSAGLGLTMAFPAGTRLGSYRISGELGVGGMGEVYRATDTILKRDVAIKLLPPAFARDADRVARFQREAEALAALNHPNIAQIHGLERSDGSTALVMELVEGPTLADRIAHGPIPCDEALGIALQVADALEAAHGKGIVHRDLKPANVKVRPDGTVKVLDFGIATAPGSPIATSGRDSPAHLTPALTEAGILLGTAAYMSPEQARGRPVDERADIWAFGCLLYEMLTGQPAFGGEDVTTTLARVLEREPNTRLLPAAVTPAVRYTIRLCLAKDARKRISHIRDVRLALAGVFGTGDAAAEKSAAGQPALRRVLAFSVALITLAAVAGFGAWRLWPAPEPRPVARFSLPISTAARTPWISISRDGARIAWAGSSMIQVRELDEFETRSVPGTQGAGTVPCFSPDGAWIAYGDGLSRLRKAPLAGGAALTLAEGLRGVSFCDWADDGNIYFGTDAGIMQVSDGGGSARLIAAPDFGRGELSLHRPQLLPGGRKLLFSVLREESAESGHVAVLDLVTTERTLVLESAGTGASFVPTMTGGGRGYLVYARGGALFAVPFDVRRLEAGSPRPVVEGVLPAILGTSNPAVSRSGILAYLSGDTILDLSLRPATLAWVGRDGEQETLPERAQLFGELKLSPDGRRAVVNIVDLATRTADFWVYEFADDRFTRVTFGGANVGAVWTPDSQRFMYVHLEGGLTQLLSPGGSSELRCVPADSSALPTTLVPSSAWGPGLQEPYSLRFDGQVLIGHRNRNDNLDVWALTLPDASCGTASGVAIAPQSLLDTRFDERHPTFSPDGRFIAYTSNESGRDEVYVVPYPGLGGKTQISRGGGERPRWNSNGRELFYLSAGQMMAIEVETSPVFRAHSPRALFDMPEIAPRNSPAHDVAPDGTRFLLLIQEDPSGPRAAELRVVVNWLEELKRLVPMN
jgi:eukaryotic-like serine/threonine-protein kinase